MLKGNEGGNSLPLSRNPNYSFVHQKNPAKLTSQWKTAFETFLPIMEGGVEVSCQQRLGARSLRVSIHVKFVIRCLLTEATTAYMPMHEVYPLYTEYQMVRTLFIIHLNITDRIDRIHATDPYRIDYD